MPQHLSHHTHHRRKWFDFSIICFVSLSSFRFVSFHFISFVFAFMLHSPNQIILLNEHPVYICSIYDFVFASNSRLIRLQLMFWFLFHRINNNIWIFLGRKTLKIRKNARNISFLRFLWLFPGICSICLQLIAIQCLAHFVVTRFADNNFLPIIRHCDIFSIRLGKTKFTLLSISLCVRVKEQQQTHTSKAGKERERAKKQIIGQRRTRTNNHILIYTQLAYVLHWNRLVSVAQLVNHMKWNNLVFDKWSKWWDATNFSIHHKILFYFK